MKRTPLIYTKFHHVEPISPLLVQHRRQESSRKWRFKIVGDAILKFPGKQSRGRFFENFYTVWVLCDEGDTLRNARWADTTRWVFVVDVTKRAVSAMEEWVFHIAMLRDKLRPG